MEGPSLIILKEEVQSFIGKKIEKIGGNSKTDKERLINQKILDFKTWGKHFIICFKDFSVRIHFLMFGSYRINEKKEMPARLSLQFKKGELNFYTCSVLIIDEDINEVYDWEADVLSDAWNPKKAIASLKRLEEIMVCDVLLNQEIFAGVGNIIKNEVLFRIKIHPKSLVKSLSSAKLKELVKEARNYSFNFYKWKKVYQLRKHWLIYKKKKCPRCNIPVIMEHTGKVKRLSFFCNNCQVLNN
ncbi:MAG: endonuclease [Chitinophagales bacterium]|nr:endonuclease [Chitinophagales bacterium]